MIIDINVVDDGDGRDDSYDGDGSGGVGSGGGDSNVIYGICLFDKIYTLLSLLECSWCMIITF